MPGMHSFFPAGAEKCSEKTILPEHERQQPNVPQTSPLSDPHMSLPTAFMSHSKHASSEGNKMSKAKMTLKIQLFFGNLLLKSTLCLKVTQIICHH